MSSNPQYEPVIGLEVHAQLLTESKAFCRCSTSFGDEPNSNVCPVCLGLPGVLPVLNMNVVEFVLRMGLATHCTIAERSIFARKNYFYPDLPKGYQISQYEEPICTGGFVEIETESGKKKKIGITRIHMEEDAGKSIHDLDVDTLVDVNRCGVPLIEIVSEPDLRSPREAYLFLHKIRQIVTYLDICDGNMEEGSLRCDANVSVRRKMETRFGTKTEVKNLNSFRFVEKALEYEIGRQIALLEEGQKIVQETLLWDAAQGVAVPMRSKEEAHDYRYFPEPDLVPVMVGKDWIDKIRTSLPEFPSERHDRYIAKLGLPKYDAEILTAEKPLADYFEAVIRHLKVKNAETWKIASNWTMTEVLRVVNERHITVTGFPVGPERFAEMINLIVDGTISGKIAKDVFEEMLTSQEGPKAIVEKKGLVQVNDASTIENAIDNILTKYEGQVREFLGGKQKVFGFLVGETMKVMKGRANPSIVNEILKKKLEGKKERD
ncbi:MAG: Asp-tRNA(Asn)/Glu-tRNA(Gln) amidotransferase subunit GatB [Ignavibacteriales bacterium]|nr:Asp-tRNA(Asn)/Glu-tRNA(Gln) amidotransferase subunit GatB [Ignavibacteriales bacterium]